MVLLTKGRFRDLSSSSSSSSSGHHQQGHKLSAEHEPLLTQFASCLLLGTTGGHLLALDLDFVHHVRLEHRLHASGEQLMMMMMMMMMTSSTFGVRSDRKCVRWS